MAGKGWKRSVEIAWIAMGLFLWSLKGTQGVRFVIDREECLSHDAKYEGDTLHVSFVVIKADSPWHFSDEGPIIASHTAPVFWIIANGHGRGVDN
ncbi:hypothetical protein QQP08_002549 [Theobroma cacao]|nr:hypothetical protein QQP08_002549 [Theobroma cacao]